jgi:hypothetical protein
MRASMKIVPAVGLAVSALALSALPAGAAATGAVKFAARAAFSGAAAPAALPNSNLKPGTTAGTVVYSPAKLSATWSAATEPTSGCTAAIESITLTNKTTKAQTITYKTEKLGKLAKKSVGGLCFYGTGTEVFKFGIEGQTSKLTVTVS